MPNVLFTLQVPPPTAIPYIIRECFFESLDGLAVYKTGSGLVSMDIKKVNFTTGLTSGSIASIREAFEYAPFVLTWAKFRGFKARFRIDVQSDANSDLKVTSGNPSEPDRFFGFQFKNDGIYGVASNGSTKSSVPLEVGKTPGWTVTKLFEANFYPASKAQFFLDGVLKGEIYTNLPTGTTSADELFWIWLVNSVAKDHLLYISYFKAWQEA